MPPRLSRFLLCLTAVAALSAGFGPVVLQSASRDLALGAAATLFVLWRFALVVRKRTERGTDPLPEPLALDRRALRDVEDRIAATVREAALFDAALLASAALLRAELGSRAASAFRVASQDRSISVAEVFGASPGLRTPWQPLQANGSALHGALAERRVCIDLPGAAALPIVDCDGAVAAAIELRALDVPVDGPALAGLLQRIGAALEASLAATARPHDEPPFALPSASQRPVAPRRLEPVDVVGDERFLPC